MSFQLFAAAPGRPAPMGAPAGLQPHTLADRASAGGVSPAVQRKSRFVWCLSAALLLALTACQAVDSTPAYDLAVNEIRAVTGAENAFHPSADPTATRERVAELLAGDLELWEAIELGLLNNPTFRASFHNIGLAHADRVQAGLLSNPSLIAALRFPSSGSSSEFEGRLLGNLLDIWQVPKRKRVAERALQRRVLELAHQAALLAGQIRVAYVEATTSDRLQNIAQENLQSAQRLLELADARLAASAGTSMDVNLARVEFLSSKIALRDAELAAGEAQRTLFGLLGLGPDEVSIRLVEFTHESPPKLPALAELERLALTRRLDLRAANEAVQEAAAELERQRGLFVRSIDVGLAAEKEGDWNLGPGLRIELPLFDQNQAQVAKALEALQQSEALLAAMQLAATQEVHSALARAQASWDALAIYRDELLPNSEAALSQARQRYELGKTTLLPALEAQRQLLAARSAYARRQFQAATALSDLERASGTPRSTLLSEHFEHGEPQL